MVALRKESVDRNIFAPYAAAGGVVALRKESVDRNRIDKSQLWVDWRSLSARRAWIEIYTPQEEFEIDEVALRKESVDRNRRPSVLWLAALRRSPQGERG